MTPVVEYIKNVGKSFVYTTVDRLGMDMPATKEFMESNEELFKDTYHSIMNIRRTKNRFADAIKKTAIYDTADYAFDNIVDSFKTGKFNDPYRQSKADAEAMGLDDFESGDSDMSMSNFDDSTGTGGSMDENTRAVIDSSASNAKSVTTATLESAKYVAGVSKANTALLFNQTLQMNQTLSAGFSGLNAGMDALNKFNTEVVQTLAQNATNYFQKTTDLMQENNAMFKEFLEMQRNLYKKENEETKGHDLEDVLGVNGMPNLKAYGKMIFKNIKEEVSENIPILDTLLENPELMKSMFANPLSVIPGIMMSAAMGPMLKTSLKKMDDTVSSIFTSFLSKMSFNSNSDDVPWYQKIMGKIFGVKYLGKSEIDTLNKQNGATPFDFQTKRAITEVIPGYLARIEAGITGSPARIYNDKTGKWTDIKTVKKSFDDQQEYAKLSGSSKLHSEMNRNMEAAKWDQHIIDIMNKVMDKVAKQRYADNGHLETFGGDYAKFAEYYGMDEDTARLFMNLYGSTSRETRAKSSGEIMRAKLNQRKSLKYEESLGSQSMYRNIFTNGFNTDNNTRANIYDRDEEGKIKRDQFGRPEMTENLTENIGGVFNLNNMSDKYGATVFDYLRSIDINTANIGGGRGRRRRKGGSPNIPPSGGSSGGYSGPINMAERPTTTNADLEDSPEKQVKITAEDITYKDKMDMSHGISRVGAFNQIKDLKQQYEENETHIIDHISNLLNDLDEIKNGKETLPGQEQYKGKWGTENIKNNETIKTMVKYLGYPGAALAGMVDSLNDSMYRFLNGDTDEMFKDSHDKVSELLSDRESPEKPKGFFENMAYGMNNMFKRMQDNIDNLDEEKKKSIWNKADAMLEGVVGFKMKDVLKEAKKTALREIGSPIMDTIEELTGTKGVLNAATNLNEAFNQAYGDPKEKEREKDIASGLANAFSQAYNNNKEDKSESDENESKRKRKGKYSDEDKNNALEMINNGMKIKDIAEATGISKSTLNNWKKNYIPGRADGATKVTKSGLTFLSKGEIVIPNASEEQRKLDGINEEKIRQKFIDQAKNAQMFSDGGQATNNDNSELSFGDLAKRFKGVAKGLTAKFNEETENTDSIYDRFKEILFGDSFKETKDTVKKVEDEIKDKVPNIAAGGLLGTAGGALIGGPLVGAVLGSALGIASNSETVQTALFGEKLVDENGKETGERNGSGLFSQEAQRTMKKYMPDMKKFGITGAVMGMFTPFGLLGGALMGSAIGFIKNNESAQETLFGKDGLIPEDAQKKLKKYFPSAAKGGAAGMFLGLAGGLGGVPLLGVAALGAGIGLVTTTDEFKDEILGKMGKDGKRHGGVLEEFKKETVGPFKKFGKDMTDGFKVWFKEDIAAPVVSAMKPMGKQMSLMAKSTIGFGKKLIKGIMAGNTGIPLIDNIMGSKAGRFTRWAGKKVGGGTKWLAKGVLSAPSKLIGKFGDTLRERQIRMGNADYMTADERREFMANRGDYAGRETDELLSEMGIDDLKRHSEMIAAVKNGREQFDENITNTRKNLYKGLSQSLDARKNNTAVKELKRLIDKNDLKGAQKYLAKLKIPKNKKAELSKMIQDAYTNIKENEYKRDNYNETKDNLLKEFSKEYGQNIDMTNIDKLESIVNNEYKNRIKEDEENKELSEEDKLADVIAGKGDEQISELQDVNTRLERLVGLFTAFTQNIGLTDKQQAKLQKQTKAGKKIMDKLTSDATSANTDRQQKMTKLFGAKGLNRDIRNRIKADDTNKFTNQLEKFHKTGAAQNIDVNYFASLDSETRDLYNTLSDQGYVIENINVISKLSSIKKEKLLKLTSAGFKVQSIKELTKLDDKYIEYLVYMMKFDAMKKLPQKTLIRFAKKYGKRFVNDEAYRKETLVSAAQKGKNFDGKIVDDNLHKVEYDPKNPVQIIDYAKNIKGFKNSNIISSQEEKEAESQQPEDVKKHSLGGLIKSAGAAIVSKGETILKAGSKAAKDWTKNKLKEKWENSAAGRAYNKASNLKATVSNAMDANGENNGMDMTKGADGRSIAANTKENADIKKAEQQKNAMQQDNNQSLHQLVAINEQIAANTMPAEEKPGGGILGGLLGLLGSFILDKVPKAWKFLKDKIKFLKDIFEGIKNIGPKIADIAPKIIKGIESLGSKIFNGLGGNKIKELFKGSKDIITGAKEGTGVLGKIGGFLGLGKTAMDTAKEGGELAKGGTQIATELSKFASLPGAKTIGGIGGKVMKGLNFYNFANKTKGLYDFATGDMDAKQKMLSDWTDKSLWEQGLDLWMTHDAFKYGKNMLTGAKNFITGAEPAAEATAKSGGLLSKGLDKAKDIGKNMKGVFNHVGGFDTLKKMGGEMGSKIMDKASGVAENMKTIISKVTELIDKAISKISGLVTEKFGKAMLKMKDIIIKKLSNPATYKMILKSGGKALAKLGLAATGVGAIVTAGWMAADAVLAFYDGFNDATNLLGLSNNYSPTMGVKMLAGTINAIFDSSIVGPIIWEPRDFFDLCLTQVGPMVGITKDQLEEECKKADENPGIIDSAWNSVKSGSKWLKDKTTDTYKAATEFVGEKATQFYEGAEKLGGKAKETLNNGIDIAYQFYEGMKEKATEVIDGFTASITEGINNLTNFIGKSWANLKNGIANGISSVITNLGNLGSSILESIKNSAVAKSVGRLWDNAKSTYNNTKYWANEKWNGAKGLWNSVKTSVKNSSLGKRIFGSGRWGTGSSAADIDSITSYEDCMELLAGIKMDSLPAQDRPSSEDDIPTLKKKAKSILSKFGKGKWGRGNKESDAWNIFHSQLDPTNSMGFNASGDTMQQSMADSGCGPVSAANIGSYFGKHIDSKDAASYALKNGYKEKNGGTKDGFFGDFLGKYGIGTKHIAPTSAKDSLRKGKPVILMGKDKSNNPILDATGNSKTPFGTNPHYVVATGLDKNDNMIIQDPESKTPNKKYKASDVMSKSSIAMDASAGMGRWGRGPTVDEDPPFGSVAASIAKQAGSEHPELFWAQMMVETGGPEKSKADISKYGEDYNYGGFTWYPDMGEDHKGTPRPSNEGGYYAKFGSDAEYAQATYNKIFKNYPDSIKTVSTPEEFAHLLKEQGYYASDESSYAAGLKAHLNGPYKDKLGNLGGMAGNISTSGGNSSGTKKYGGLFGAFNKLSDVFGAILNGDDDGSSSGGNTPGGSLANGGVPANTGLDYLLKNMPGAQVTSNYKDESGRPTPGEHGGIDIAASENTPVPTPVGGTVQDANTDDGYGNYVQIKDNNGNYHLFGHLNQHKVKTGDSVTRGSIIGLEGSTGHSTGPHVHYQIDPPDNVNAVKSGPHLDPSTYSLNGLGKWGLGKLKAKFGKGKWGTGNGAAIWDNLKGKGLGSSAIAGIMGNMQAESGLDPTIVQGGGHSDEVTVDGSTGYGLCQWTSEGRQQNLKDFAASKGTKSGDLNTQLDFMLKEVGEGYGDLLQRMDGMSPYDAALLFHKEFERSADTGEMAKRRGEYANQIAQSEGKGETFNGSYSGSSSGGKKKHTGLFGAFDAISDVFSTILNGDDSDSGSTPGMTNGGAAGGHSSDPGIKNATEWANSMTGQQGFGNNGCTEFVKQYLQKAGNPVGQYMADGSQGNLMWVPSLEDWAKEHNMFKPSSAGGAEGDIAITNDHSHVTIADGDGGTWGNSSSQNKILHYKSIADAFGTPDGYIATGSGDSKVSEGASKRSAADMMADGGTSNGWGGSKWGRGGFLNFITNAQGSWGFKKNDGHIPSLWHPYLGTKNNSTTSTTSLLSKIESANPKTPMEFRKITDEDIDKVKSIPEAFGLLRSASIPIDKIPDMNIPKDTDSLDVIRAKLKKIVATIKPERAADVDENGLVDSKYEKNDVDYLLNNGYTKDAAIELLSKDPKYTEKKTDLEKKMDNNSFNLDRVKKNFQDKVKQLLHGDENKQQQSANGTPTKSSDNTTGAQATPAAAQIDYTEKFDTMINLLSTLVQVFTNGTTANGTGVTTSNASAINMVNSKNVNNVRSDELAKLFTNINNSMNALASR